MDESSMSALSAVHRKAIAAAEQLATLTAPFVGQWVALSHEWDRVIAADADHGACLRKARAHMRPGEIPSLHRIR